MAKPRIIVADTDESYIIPLQHKFAADFYNKLDVEIITDEQYFRQAFSTPQHVDILIVSENLYDSSIQRHNISNIFIMTEQHGEGRTAELNLNYMYKYTSIKEIFNEIIGKSIELIKPLIDKVQKTQVVLFCSAAGGTGKTTLSMGVSATLKKNYNKKVLYINAARLQTFGWRLENSSAIGSAEIYARLASGDTPGYPLIKHLLRNERFCYLPPFKAALMSIGLDYSVYENIIRSARDSGDFDFIVVDADVGFDAGKANLMRFADKVIIVTSQYEASVFATNTLVSNINGINDDKYIFICNDFNKNEHNALLSSRITPLFSVTEYVEHFIDADELGVEELSRESSIQKIALLIM